MMIVRPGSKGSSDMVVLQGEDEIREYLANLDPQTKQHFAYFPKDDPENPIADPVPNA